MFRNALLAAALLLSSFAVGCAATSEPAASTPSSGEGASPESPDVGQAESEQNANGRVGTHGMVVFGKPGVAYFSHIPMFGGPMHDVQLIVRGKLVGQSLPTTLSDRLYTFLPARLSLDALRLGNLREVTGTLYLGNFEDGGRPIANNVRFTVEKVVHQHLLVASARATADDDVIEIGDADAGEDTFTAHRIGGAPSFDEIKTSSGKTLSCLEGPDFTRSCATDQP